MKYTSKCAKLKSSTIGFRLRNTASDISWYCVLRPCVPLTQLVELDFPETKVVSQGLTVYCF